MVKFFKSHFLQCLVNGIRFFRSLASRSRYEHGRSPTHHTSEKPADLRIETPSVDSPENCPNQTLQEGCLFFIVIAYKKLYPPFSPYMTSG